MPLLTVRETFQFALDNSVADPSLLHNEELKKLHADKVEFMLDLLGLKECAETIVGNALLRGISGGQKKRVTLGELMITNARLLCLDEISTGLDAAAALDITKALRTWTRVMGGTAAVSLLQATPEIYVNTQGHTTTTRTWRSTRNQRQASPLARLPAWIHLCHLYVYVYVFLSLCVCVF